MAAQGEEKMFANPYCDVVAKKIRNLTKRMTRIAQCEERQKEGKPLEKAQQVCGSLYLPTDDSQELLEKKADTEAYIKDLEEMLKKFQEFDAAV